jgi:hypothetical protein
MMMLSPGERSKLLAQAQRLKEARLVDFSQEARTLYDAKQANLFKYSGDDAALRRKLIDAGFAEVVQRGARSRPGIIKIHPNGNAPQYVPRERLRDDDGERARPARERPARERQPASRVLNPKDIMQFAEYLRTRKEAWRVETRRAVEDEFADVAPSINKLGFDRVRQYLNRVGSVSGADGWRMHLRDQFGEDIVEFFAAELSGARSD